MKKYLSLSVASYVVAVIWFYSTEATLLYSHPRSVMGLAMLLLILGIGLGVKSVNAEKTGWIGRVSIIVGLILLVTSVAALMMELSPI